MFTNFTHSPISWSSLIASVCNVIDDESVCPKAENLKDLQQIGIWAEGVGGDFDLEILGVYSDTL